MLEQVSRLLIYLEGFCVIEGIQVERLTHR